MGHRKVHRGRGDGFNAWGARSGSYQGEYERMGKLEGGICGINLCDVGNLLTTGSKAAITDSEARSMTSDRMVTSLVRSDHFVRPRYYIA